MTYEEAQGLRLGQVLHYTGRKPCTRVVGPRGGITDQVVQVRVSGAVKLWKTDPSRIRIPVKYGLYESSAITADNMGDFHLPEDCPRLK